MANIFEQVPTLLGKSKEYLRNLNFYPAIPSLTDEYELRTQRISTRIFIITFSILFTILLLYNSLIKDTKIVSVKEPSFLEYAHLNSIYSQTLICPCSKISIDHGKFLHVEYTLHQVCSSMFLDQNWMIYLKYWVEHGIVRNDFRGTGPYAFQALKGLCELLKQRISIGLGEFNSNQYVTASIIPQNIFESEIKSTIETFRSSMATNFLLSLEIIQGTTQANALLSALQTNYYIFIDKFYRYGRTNPMHYNDCDCATSFACTFQSSIEDYPNSTSLFNVPNFYKGCYIVESLLQSSLECFYDTQCIKKLQSYISSSSPINITALDASLSNYSKNSTIKELVNNLMIEKWNATPIFERYYNECQPTNCTYSFMKRHDLIYIATTLFGLAGGLTTVLNFIVPRLIKFIRKKKQQRRQPLVS